MFEVEKRILIDDKKLEELKTFFDQKGKLEKDFKRFTILKISKPNFVPDKDDKLDIRIRTTLEKAVLTIKKGDWDDSSAREEVEIKFDISEVKDMLRMINMLGLNYFLMTYVQRLVYKYEGFEIVLDKYLSSDENIMEVELMAEDQNSITIAEEKIFDFLDDIDLQPLDSDGLIAFLAKLNSNNEFQLDLTKTTVEEWYRKYKDYILCQK